MRNRPACRHVLRKAQARGGACCGINCETVFYIERREHVLRMPLYLTLAIILEESFQMLAIKDILKGVRNTGMHGQFLGCGRGRLKRVVGLDHGHDPFFDIYADNLVLAHEVGYRCNDMEVTYMT